MLRLFKVFEVQVYAHWSLLFLFCLVCPSIYGAVLTETHSALESMIVAGLIGVLFVGSILVHELAHARTGQALGVGFDSITLFVLGGIASMNGQLKRPKAEFLMAGAGPLCSLVVGGLCLVLMAFTPDGLIVRLMFAYVGIINIVLGVFNGFIPILFPSDASRMLRAVLWHCTGSFVFATKIAARLGQGGSAAFVLMGVVMVFGVQVPFFGTGLSNGLWTAVIGAFLFTMATKELRSVE